MPYITINVEQRLRQITFDDIMNGCDESLFTPRKDTRDTRTWYANYVNDKLLRRTNFCAMYSALVGFNQKYADLIAVEDKSTLYRSFKIPKRSGGLRQIDAPNEELTGALRELKEILERKFYASYSTHAYAYIKGRSTIDSVRKHQQNNSRWFLKADFSKFFPSTTSEFLMRMLCMTYPISEFVNWGHDYRAEFEKAISLCFLNGGLPQGTPTSPLLTNMMMIPIDHAISKMCREHKPHLCYTRYADDILISSEYSFMWTDVQNKIIKILGDFNAPFVLNPSKSRYGSRNGRNWNLGVMLNQDNEITVGYRKKKQLKTMIFQFMTDYERGISWSLEDTQHLQGLVSYYKMVEGVRIDEIINAYSNKFNKDVVGTIKEILRTA